ncbi:hypothetical protein B0H11DRAFT_2002208, partial [Mycena galericulata]
MSLRDRPRTSRRHGDISSQSLFLGLSLLATGLVVVVAMLLLPTHYSADTNSAPTDASPGAWSTNRTQALIARENAVFFREAEVAQREAEVRVANLVDCPPCAAPTVFETITSPAQTVIIEEYPITPPTMSNHRVRDLVRERRVAERERDVSNSEQSVSHREHDASRRERWIMEQLSALHNGIETEYL